jgi:ribulose-phosphate 3-epimerase
MNRDIRLSASMMCADISRVPETLAALKDAQIDWLHIDVMDGAFVPNIQLGVDYVRQLRGLSDIPLDIHIMAYEPERKVDWLAPQPDEYVSVHFEATPHPQRVLANIRGRGARPMIALNPATPVESVEYLLEDIDAVLVMTVNPGYAGQKLIPATIEKISRLRTFLDERGYRDTRIEADGNVSAANAKKMIDAGADTLVLGSSAIFKDDMPLCTAIQDFKTAAALQPLPTGSGCKTA